MNIPTSEETKCPCGSVIALKASMNRHLKTKRHQKFLESGVSKPKNQAKYMRRKYASNPQLREKHRALCKKYYKSNHETIRQRQNNNGAINRFRSKTKLIAI